MSPGLHNQGSEPHRETRHNPSSAIILERRPAAVVAAERRGRLETGFSFSSLTRALLFSTRADSAQDEVLSADGFRPLITVLLVFKSCVVGPKLSNSSRDIPCSAGRFSNFFFSLFFWFSTLINKSFSSPFFSGYSRSNH